MASVVDAAIERGTTQTPAVSQTAKPGTALSVGTGSVELVAVALRPVGMDAKARRAATSSNAPNATQLCQEVGGLIARRRLAPTTAHVSSSSTTARTAITSLFHATRQANDNGGSVFMATAVSVQTVTAAIPTPRAKVVPCTSTSTPRCLVRWRATSGRAARVEVFRAPPWDEASLARTTLPASSVPSG